MSDKIPFHIQEEIMKRLPVKSLIQFRCVSKAWKSLIDSSDFIAAHCVHSHIQPQYLLVSYDNLAFEEDYVLFSRCYIDDYTFSQQSSGPTLPLSIKQHPLQSVVGSSQGLLCLYGTDPNITTETIVLCNPSVRKSIVVDVPGEPFEPFDCPVPPCQPFLGFGVCPITSDPKIVMITQFSEVMVYSLNSGKWRSLSTDPPIKSLRHWWSIVATNQFIYWRAESQTHRMIVSFDMTNESFEVIDLPDCLAHSGTGGMGISKLRESLALLQHGDDFNNSTVWIMEHGAQRSFTKLFTIKTPHEYIVGFSRSGIPIVQYHDDEQLGKLVVYEPNSEHNNVLEICSPVNFSFVNSYKETLLLHGRSDCSSY